MSTIKADYLVNAAGTGAPTLTNGAVLPAGSAAAPAISPTGDTNTGIFFPAADTIAFSEGGAEAMRIDASGNVGIGGTSGGAKLDVVATGSGTAAQFSGGGTYQGFAVKNNQSSASVYGGTYFDARNELDAAVANFLADINTDGSSAWSWSTQVAGTRTDRRVERMRIGSSGQIGIGGANYGTSGQVLTSGGSGAAPSWAAAAGVPTTVGSVGSLAFLSSLSNVTQNTDYAGSGLYWASAIAYFFGSHRWEDATTFSTVSTGPSSLGSPSGTWRALGSSSSYGTGGPTSKTIYGATLFLRIS